VNDHHAQCFASGIEQVGAPTRVSENTVFQVASLTKPFTAMTILRLAERGVLSVDDKAAMWLSWLPELYGDVSVRHLLTHTSGVPRDLRQANVDEFSIDEFQRRLVKAERSVPTGTKREYSNTGYILLSLIAERASGRSFGELLQNEMFAPLGMNHSSYRASLKVAAGRASGYDWDGEKWVAAPPIYSGFGNSGIESTLSDLTRFAEALHDRKLLRPASYTLMLSKQFFAGLLAPVTVKFTIRALSVSGDGMIAAADVFQEVSRFREIEGQRQKLDTTVVQRETWIKTKEGWRLKLVDNVRDQTRRIDGKD
jgi:CubicO group peptidase (beta-lactamase class C family)